MQDAKLRSRLVDNASHSYRHRRHTLHLDFPQNNRVRPLNPLFQARQVRTVSRRITELVATVSAITRRRSTSSYLCFWQARSLAAIPNRFVRSNLPFVRSYRPGSTCRGCGRQPHCRDGGNVTEACGSRRLVAGRNGAGTPLQRPPGC